MLSQDIKEKHRCHGCGTYKVELKESPRKLDLVACVACCALAAACENDSITEEQMQKIILERKRLLLSEEVGFEIPLSYARASYNSCKENVINKLSRQVQELMLQNSQLHTELRQRG